MKINSTRILIIFSLSLLIIGLIFFNIINKKNIQTEYSPTGKLGMPFELINSNGNKITEKAFIGSPTALFFGFAIISLAHGLQGTLLGVRAVVEGFSFISTGIVSSSALFEEDKNKEVILSIFLYVKYIPQNIMLIIMRYLTQEKVITFFSLA